MGVFAEMERNIISQRVKSGMKNARAKGKQIGRPPITMDRLPDKFWKYYQSIRLGEINVSGICEAVEMFESDDI